MGGSTGKLALAIAKDLLVDGQSEVEPAGGGRLDFREVGYGLGGVGRTDTEDEADDEEQREQPMDMVRFLQC